MRIVPVEKNMERIMLGQPVTENPNLNDRYTTQIAIKIEEKDIAAPIPIANFSGRSEKERIISRASLILFFNV